MEKYRNQVVEWAAQAFDLGIAMARPNAQSIPICYAHIRRTEGIPLNNIDLDFILFPLFEKKGYYPKRQPDSDALHPSGVLYCDILFVGLVSP